MKARRSPPEKRCYEGALRLLTQCVVAKLPGGLACSGLCSCLRSYARSADISAFPGRVRREPSPGRNTITLSIVVFRPSRSAERAPTPSRRRVCIKWTQPLAEWLSIHLFSQRQGAVSRPASVQYQRRVHFVRVKSIQMLHHFLRIGIWLLNKIQ